MTYEPPPNAVIDSLGEAVRYSHIDEVPDLVVRVVKDDLWREFTTKMNKNVEHPSFESFVTTEPLDGLGASMQMLRRLCTGHTEALDAIDRATQRPAGGDQKSQEARINVSNRNIDRPVGTTADQALRRLRKDRPDLHQQVLDGEMTPHAAMVEAGFRPKTITVRIDDPERIAATLHRRLDQDVIKELVLLLTGERDQS